MFVVANHVKALVDLQQKIESAKKLLASGVPPQDVAKNLDVSVATL
jgi:hypothetical protein